jgi:hypothetical protein
MAGPSWQAAPAAQQRRDALAFEVSQRNSNPRPPGRSASADPPGKWPRHVRNPRRDASRLGVYQASTPEHNPGQARASAAFAISTNSSLFVCLRRRASPRFTAPCTTHNREVGGSNPPGAMSIVQRSAVSVAGTLVPAAINSVVRSSIARFRRCRPRSDQAVAGESPFGRPPRVHNRRLLPGKRDGCRPLAGVDCRWSRIAALGECIDGASLAGQYCSAGAPPPHANASVETRGKHRLALAG